MSISLYLGRFFGLYLLILGVLFIVRANSVRTVIHEIAKDPALLALAGGFTFTLGLLLVLAHNHWDWNWRLLVTVLSYILLIQGIVRLFLPEWTKEVAHRFDHAQSVRVAGFIMAVIGIFLLVCTFFTSQTLQWS